jgi:hypothetical protein
LQAGGHRFDPGRLHHGALPGVLAMGSLAVSAALASAQAEAKAGATTVSWMFVFDVTAGLGMVSRMWGCVACVVAVVTALFFGNVNQVLVRLWARVTVLCLRMEWRSRRLVVCLTGKAVLHGTSAPAVGRRGFRGAVNNLARRFFIAGASRRQESCCGRIGMCKPFGGSEGCGVRDFQDHPWAGFC